MNREEFLDTIKEITQYKKIKLDYVVINDGSFDYTKKVLIDNNINFIDLTLKIWYNDNGDVTWQ